MFQHDVMALQYKIIVFSIFTHLQQTMFANTVNVEGTVILL